MKLRYQEGDGGGHARGKDKNTSSAFQQEQGMKQDVRRTNNLERRLETEVRMKPMMVGQDNDPDRGVMGRCDSCGKDKPDVINVNHYKGHGLPQRRILCESCITKMLRRGERAEIIGDGSLPTNIIDDGSSDFQRRAAHIAPPQTSIPSVDVASPRSLLIQILGRNRSK